MMNNITERDLMIGDLVQFDEDVCIVEEVRVDDTVVLVSLNTDLTSVDGDQVSIDEISPIELTTEILEKNFPTIEDGVTWSETADSDLFNIRVEYDKYVEGIFKYVHELQHALRLCGIDKEIKL